MAKSSGAWARTLTLVVALVVALLAAALPALGATTTKNYSAALRGGVDGGREVTVPSGDIPNAVTLDLTNRQESQQSFGSAQLDFTRSPLPTHVSAPGWTTEKLDLANGVRFRVISLTSAKPVPPGASLAVTITMPETQTGTTELTTRVKQSNDFNGTNNDFTLVTPPTQPLKIVTASSCANTCTPDFTSDVNRVRADLTITSSSAFTYTAGFTRNRLSCDTIPFGDPKKVPPEPFLVDAAGSSPVSKTLVLTFPKALANLVPDNGTPLHPVCAGADVAFPGSSRTTGRPAGTFTYPHEGLLLNCTNPVYVDAVAAYNADPNPQKTPLIPMCVSSRARNAGNLIVTIRVELTTFDPRFW